jgi:hypothetical protein
MSPVERLLSSFLYLVWRDGCLDTELITLCMALSDNGNGFMGLFSPEEEPSLNADVPAKSPGTKGSPAVD